MLILQNCKMNLFEMSRFLVPMVDPSPRLNASDPGRTLNDRTSSQTTDSKCVRQQKHYLLLIRLLGPLNATIIERIVVIEQQNEEMPQSTGLKELQLENRILRQ